MFDRPVKTDTTGFGINKVYYESNDEHQNVIRTVNAENKQHTQIKDYLDRVVKTIDHNGNAVVFDFDAYGKQIQVSMGQSESYVATCSDVSNANILNRRCYDAVGRLQSTFTPERGQESFAYNSYGQTVSATDSNGIETTISYDDLGRKTVSRTLEQTNCWVYGTETGADSRDGTYYKNIGQVIEESSYQGIYVDCSSAVN